MAEYISVYSFIYLSLSPFFPLSLSLSLSLPPSLPLPPSPSLSLSLPPSLSSAGVGRTGVFCAVSTAIEQVKAEGLVDIFYIVKQFRTQRPHMVQSVVSSEREGRRQYGDCLTHPLQLQLVSFYYQPLS